METSLHQQGFSLDAEAGNADLITDIVTPTVDRSAGISSLARDMAIDSRTWRAAWELSSEDDALVEDPALTAPPLNYDEDDELRGLNKLAELGRLTEEMAERFIELRLRDRRSEVRPPRGFVIERDVQAKRKWALFRRQ